MFARALAILLLLWTAPALAYRPFDSTDADIASPREVELELSPFGYLRAPEGQFFVVPNFVLNFGIARRWELVMEGRGLSRVHSELGGTNFRLEDSALRLKYVVREGSLQEKRGVSIAMEYGALFPSTAGGGTLGAAVDTIISHRWEYLVAHLNLQAGVTPETRLDLFGGLILEGSWNWPVRPVGEIFVEREFGDHFTVSGLGGLIWPVSEELSFDAAVRVARAWADEGGLQVEVRAGFTWAFSFGAEKKVEGVP